MKRWAPVFSLLWVLGSRSAAAEIIDKEPTPADIWWSLALPVGLAVVFGIISRWLLLVSFFLSIPSAATFAWTEWYNVQIGPHLAKEAGLAYGRHANGAVVAIVLSHLILWVASTRFGNLLFRRKSSRSSGARTGFVTSSIFLLGLAMIMVLAAESGFTGTASRIWCSPPFLALALGGAVAVAASSRVSASGERRAVRPTHR